MCVCCFVLVSSRHFLIYRVETARFCFPAGFTKHLIPLLTSVTALTFTGVGGWDCTFFQGATIRFTGNRYGLWTLEDVSGKCQLWDVLFFNFTLGGPLVTARVFSMTAMLLGLALVATMAQASQFHLASWGIGLALFILFVISLSTTSIFNVWVVFWLFTYAIMVLMIRAIFIHPVARHISTRGSKIIAACYIFCALCCLMTMVVLKSDYCTCSNITSERLEDRNVGQPCNGSCSMGWAGYAMVVASVLWIAAAVCCLKFGIQPETLNENRRRPKEWYAHYPHQSMVTRAVNFATRLGHRSGHGGSSTNSKSHPQHHHSSNSNNSQQGSTTSSQPPLLEAQSSIVRSSLSSTSATASATTTNQKSVRFQDSNTTTDGTATQPAERIQMKPINELHSHHDLTLETNKEITPADDEENSLLAAEHSRELEQQDQSDLAALYDATPSGDHEDAELDWSDLEDTRGWCQKCCCDYRIEPRSRKERWMFWSFRTILGLGFVIYALFVYMLIGSRSENTAAAKKPDTTPYFTTNWVCAFNPLDPKGEEFQSFVNQEAAKAQNWTIAHCGKCGYCSNPHDIQTYVETRKTIAKTAKKCGPKVFLGTYDDLVDCLEDRIGFTRPCTECWADNMDNTAEKCLSTCMRTLFSGFMTDNNVPGAGDQGWLNQCLFCDEKMSGPAFVTCSGVARRRLGIQSEIERNPVEQCKRVDIDWVNVNWKEIGFED